MSDRPIITLLTDYGLRDHYVAALKGAILSIVPQAHLVDVTHEIEPQNIADGAFALRQAMTAFPPGTIHVAVVDPTVGSPRRILLGKYEGQFVIAPDNGLLTWTDHDFKRQELRVVENKKFAAKKISSTFHGRDIIGTAAAHLALGTPLEDFGPTTDRIEQLAIPPRAAEIAGGLTGQVIYVDRFGTLVTNIHHSQVAVGGPPPLQGGIKGGKPLDPSVDRNDRTESDSWRVSVNDTEIGPVRSAFHEVPPGELVAYIGSSDFLEVAVNCGRAIDYLGPREALLVHVSRAP